MAVTVDVYGSCVSKDVFRYVSPGKYTFRRCVTQTPISTLYEPAFQFQAEHVDGMQMSKYEKTIFKVQTQKVLPQILRKNKSDMLVIDLADGALSDKNRFEIRNYGTDCTASWKRRGI